MRDVFKSLDAALADPHLSAKLKSQVQAGVAACQANLEKTQVKLEKLQSCTVPIGARQKTWAELQRDFYPLRASTLAKLRELMRWLRDDLSFAMNVLQVDLGVDIVRKLDDLSIRSQAIADELLLVKDQGSVLDVKLDSISDLASDISGQINHAKTHVVETKQKVDVLEHHVETLADKASREERESMIRWISPADVARFHETAQRRHEGGTGEWLLNGSHYAHWKTSAQPLCWINGKAGSGKTILCSTVIDDLKKHVASAKDESSQLVYFYFSFSDQQKKSLTDFLRSIVAQLCHLTPVFDLLKSIKKSSSTGGPSVDDLRRVLELALKHTRLFVVIDALDEVPETGDQRRDVLDWINSAIATARDKIKIFASSRAEQNIKAMMVDAVQIDIQRGIVDNDIKKYVSNELRRDERLRSLSDDLKLHIEHELSTRADGM
jgi:DNA replication protein DnaC